MAHWTDSKELIELRKLVPIAEKVLAMADAVCNAGNMSKALDAGIVVTDLMAFRAVLDKIKEDARPKEKIDTYIVYNIQTKVVVQTFVCFSKELDALLKQSNGTLGWINRTHPNNKDLLNELTFPEVN